MLRLQFALNLLPFPLLVLEQDPGGGEKTDLDSPTHENRFSNTTTVQLGNVELMAEVFCACVCCRVAAL